MMVAWLRSLGRSKFNTHGFWQTNLAYSFRNTIKNSSLERFIWEIRQMIFLNYEVNISILWVNFEEQLLGMN